MTFLLSRALVFPRALSASPSAMAWCVMGRAFSVAASAASPSTAALTRLRATRPALSASPSAMAWCVMGRALSVAASAAPSSTAAPTRLHATCPGAPPAIARSTVPVAPAGPAPTVLPQPPVASPTVAAVAANADPTMSLHAVSTVPTPSTAATSLHAVSNVAAPTMATPPVVPLSTMSPRACAQQLLVCHVASWTALVTPSPPLVTSPTPTPGFTRPGVSRPAPRSTVHMPVLPESLTSRATQVTRSHPRASARLLSTSASDGAALSTVTAQTPVAHRLTVDQAIATLQERFPKNLFPRLHSIPSVDTARWGRRPRDQWGPTASEFFCSVSTRSAIDAYHTNGSPGQVRGVPLDKRTAAREIYNDWREATFNLSPGRDDARRPLLCNAASSGSGKSVLLAFNLLWFKEDVGGIPVYVTFNDDQGSGRRRGDLFDTVEEFELQVALRVLHRVLAPACGASEMRKIRRRIGVIEQTLRAVGTEEEYLQPALAIARRVLGAPEDTAVLLAVDELRKYAGDSSEYLKHLCRLSDADPRLHLTVSALGAVDIQKFATGSNRFIYLQPLPPIFPMAALPSSDRGGIHADIRALPPVLRVFADPARRAALPPGKRSLYATLSRILRNTGGNPRGVECVLHVLKNKFSDKIDTFSSDGFLKVLEVACNGDLEKSCDDLLTRIPFSTIPAANLEAIARDTACRFEFPTDSDGAEAHCAMLRGTLNGQCQFIPQVSLWGHAFVPYPVLKKNFPKRVLARNREVSSPCRDALHRLKLALDDFIVVEIGSDRGKPLERLAFASFLLFLRANRLSEDVEEVALFSETCRDCGDDSAVTEVSVTGPVAVWDDVTKFPQAGDTGGLQDLVARLGPGTAGAMFMPTNLDNPSGDFFGLFRNSPASAADETTLVLVVFQCKDWFKAPKVKGVSSGAEKLVDVLEEWRDNQGLMWNAMPAHFGEAHGPDTNVPPASFEVPVAPVAPGQPSTVARVAVHYVLFTTNPVRSILAVPKAKDSKLGLRSNESVTDLATLSTWLPTAGLNAIAAHRLREMFLLASNT